MLFASGVSYKMNLLALPDVVQSDVSDQMTLVSLYAFFCTCNKFAGWSRSDWFWVRRARVKLGVTLGDSFYTLLQTMPKSLSKLLPTTKRQTYLMLHHIGQVVVYPTMERDIAPGMWKDLHMYPYNMAQVLAKGLMETDTFTDFAAKYVNCPLRTSVTSRSMEIISDCVEAYLRRGHTLSQVVRDVDAKWVYRRKLKKVIRKRLLTETVKPTWIGNMLQSTIAALKGHIDENLINSINHELYEVADCIDTAYEMLLVIRLIDIIYASGLFYVRSAHSIVIMIGNVIPDRVDSTKTMRCHFIKALANIA